MKYLKKFETVSAYNAAESGLIRPNVSYITESGGGVRYNPLVPPQPIAPVGKAQVFANPECTEYADGQSRTVYVRLNQDFGIDDYTEWGSISNWNESLKIYTPTTEYPNDPYGIELWVDWHDENEHTTSFSSGDIVECICPEGAEGGDYNFKVIFE